MIAESSTDETYHGNTVIIRPSQTDVGTGNTSAGSALSIFLSSTIGDLEDYRSEVQDALLKKAQVACFLSEDWVNSYSSTKRKCQKQLEKSGGFIGVFAYWYGSVLRNSTQSVTHLEFLWALQKWAAEDDPPIAVLMPKSPSKAERFLKKKAAELVKESPIKDDHPKLLKQFHQAVTNAGKTVARFTDKRDLREQVIVLCLEWKLGRPMDAARGTVEVVKKTAGARFPTDEELGLLGRQPQIDAFDRILNRVGLYPKVPALAVLVHGDADAGQRVFLRQLITRKKLRSGRPTQLGRPQVNHYDLKALVQWVGESVGVLPKGKEVATPEDLADLIHQELANQQLSFVLNEAYRLAGGVTAWQQDFWQPLYARLAELRKLRSTPHRLIAVIADYQDCSTLSVNVAGPFTNQSTDQDFAHLLTLPSLSEITSGDFMDWLDALEVPDGAGNRRAELTNDALEASGGQTDGNPLRVYERLRDSKLWEAEKGQ